MSKLVKYKVNYDGKYYLVNLKEQENDYIIWFDKSLEDRIKIDIENSFFNKSVTFPEGAVVGENYISIYFNVVLFAKDDFKIDIDNLVKKGFDIVFEMEILDEEKDDIFYRLNQILPKTMVFFYKKEYKNHRIKILTIEKKFNVIDKHDEAEEWLRRELNKIFGQKE